MRRRELLAKTAALIAAGHPVAALAQASRRVRRIGLLSAATSASLSGRAASALLAGLADLGWIDGQTVIIERRFADNDERKLAILAADLAQSKIDVVVAIGTLAPLAARQATTTVPIVMTAAGDPIGSGLVASLAKPGGNVTGLSLMSPDLAGKRLQMLKQISPDLTRISVLWNARNPYSARVFAETAAAALSSGVEAIDLRLASMDDVSTAFGEISAARAQAIITVEDPFTLGLREQIADRALKLNLPSLGGFREFAIAGALLSYGADIADLYRRAATYIDRILKGDAPADLPVQQPIKFELIVNLKTARILGVSIPAILLASADEVIE